MILLDGPTKLNAKQIKLDSLFSVDRILASRGFRISKEGNALSTILPKEYWTWQEANLIFSAFDNELTRSKLLNLTYDLSRESCQTASELVGLDLVIDRNRFSTTFEWYVGELLVRRFGAFSASFGVQVDQMKRSEDGGNIGDFDVIAVMGDMNILYVECKTGGCSQQSIHQTIRRASQLHTVASVILLDKGVKELSLIQQVSSRRHPRYATGTPIPLMRIGIIDDSESFIYRWYNCFFIAGGKQTQLESRIRTVLRILASDRVSWQEFSFSGGRRNFTDNGYSFESFESFESI